MCVCNTEIEDNAHYFLRCPLFAQMRNELLEKLSYIPELDLSEIDSKPLLNLLLYGSPKSNETDNRMILEAAIAYIKATDL